MSEFKDMDSSKFRKYAEDRAIRIKLEKEVNLREIAQAITTYTGDGGCAAKTFFDLLMQRKEDQKERINKVVNEILDYIEEKINQNELDFGRITQNVFAASRESGITLILDKTTLQRMTKTLKNKKYTIAMKMRKFEQSPVIDIQANYLSLVNYYEAMSK